VSAARHTPSHMDDQRIGWSLRSIRVRKRWRQEDLAARAKVSRWVVMRIEQGRLASVPLGKVRAVAAALDARVDAVVRWQGGDLSRLVSARHARMHEMIARYFSGVPGWIVEPEVSFSIYGERGIIDVLAWHPTTRILLVIELKTEVVDLNEMLGVLDRKRRLAWDIAKDRKWDPVVVSTWVVVADSRTNRRTVAGHRAVLRAKLPIDGRGVARWLRRPNGRIDALSFLPNVQGLHPGVDPAPIRRVVRRQSRPRRVDPSVD
jgi:transcriptional regulator with XRE-family HTH domain